MPALNARRGPLIAAAAGGALAIALVVSAIGCSRHDSLVLLDLRASGPLGAPVVRVRLSAKGWPTHTVAGSIGPDGFRVGYYGPASGGAVSVTAEALDDAACVLGSGSATVPKLAAGATSDPITLFVRPTPANGCVDAGAMDAGGNDDGGVDGGDEGDAGDAGDAGADSTADVPDDAPEDAPEDAGADGDLDAALDAGD
jgi:hypothetical protein